ncbi:MAG: hypothetical protein NT131_04590 [Methanomassiliicoccales archaeon]|nr:hypothetical protein [Methanomassiliicoccales archaeon]
MMEFYLSKVWAFVVGAVLMGVLVQGVQMQGQTAKEGAMQEVADNIREMLNCMNEAGPGLEQEVELHNILPASSTLTVHRSYAMLDDGNTNISFRIPSARLFVQLTDGTYVEVDSLVLRYSDYMKVVTDEGGLMLTALSQRTYLTGT